MSDEIVTYLGKAPISSVRTERMGGHYHVSVWVNHGKSGDLVVREDELTDLLKILSTGEVVGRGPR